MSHPGGNTLRTALIAVAAAAVFILGCGLFTLHVYVRAVPLTSRGQRCSAVPLGMSASVNRSLEAWSWGGSIARMLEDAGEAGANNAGHCAQHR